MAYSLSDENLPQILRHLLVLVLTYPSPLVIFFFSTHIVRRMANSLSEENLSQILRHLLALVCALVAGGGLARLAEVKAVVSKSVL